MTSYSGHNPLHTQSVEGGGAGTGEMISRSYSALQVVCVFGREKKQDLFWTIPLNHNVLMQAKVCLVPEEAVPEQVF